MTLFNKTLIATKNNLRNLETVNATVYNKHGVINLKGLTTSTTKSVGTFTKLDNAFKAYNSNLSKSTQLQNAYIKAVGKQHSALGNYLAGLNGAKASMGGYIKSLVGAKAATIGLQVASIALNAAITMGISSAINAIVSQIQKWANTQEEARQKTVELTNLYKEQQTSLESQIEKYKKLKETLDNGNLSTDEALSIKEQLLEIQQSLIESYGDEVSNIDLVNGKYKEQLGLLGKLSKERATDYVTENRDTFVDANEALTKERTYDLGTVASWNNYSPKTEDEQKLLDYIDAYSDLLNLTYSGAGGATFANIYIKADVASADELMHQFAEDLEKYGEENNIDVSGILESISGQLKNIWTDELTEYKTVYDEFMKAEIVRNDTLRPLYQESIQAVEDYNKALSTGEGVEEAKANLESVQQSVQSATGKLEGSQGVFDGIYEGINKNAEAAYNLGKAFENDKTVQSYAEQLRGLTDIDLKSINFDNDNTEKGEEAFKGLMETLGLTEEQVQNLINKLIELGYMQGEVQSSTLDNKIDVSSKSKMIDTINSMSDGMEVLDNIYADIIDGGTLDFTNLDTKKFEEQFAGLEDEYVKFIETVSASPTDIKACQESFNKLTDAYIKQKGVLSDLSEENAQVAIDMLENMGIVNAEEVVTNMLNGYTEAMKLAEIANIDFANATAEEINALTGLEVEFAETGDAAFDYYLRKKLCSDGSISTVADCNALIALAQQCQVTGENLQLLVKLRNIYNVIESDMWGPATKALAVKEAEKLTAQLMTLSVTAVDYGGATKSATAAQKNLAEATDKATEALEAQKSALEDQKQYYDDVAEAITWFYNKQINKTESLIDNLEKENELLQEQLDGYDSALSAIDRFYEKEIDAIQSKIDAMDEANEAAEREIALEKAKEALLAARNNRTVMQYQKGVGFVYTTDEAAIKEAENNLADAEQEKAKADLQAEIDKLEHYRELWADIPNIKQKAEEDSMMIQLLGTEWESILLSGRLENITAFKNQYVALQTEIDSNERLIASYEEKIAYYEALKQEWDNLLSKYEEDTYIQLLITEFGKDYESELLNGRTLSWQQFTDNYSHIKDELNRVTDEIDAIAKRAEEYAARISQAASGAKKELDSLADSPLPKNTPYESKSSQDHARANGYAIGFSTGGIVSENSRSNLDYLAKANGEDHTVFVKEGEAIISKKTVDANQRIIQQLLAAQGKEIDPNISIENTIYFKRMKEIGFTPQFVFPQPNLYIGSVRENSPVNNFYFSGNLSFPNIHSHNDVQLLIQELSTLSQKAEQRVRRRR